MQILSPLKQLSLRLQQAIIPDWRFLMPFYCRCWLGLPTGRPTANEQPLAADRKEGEAFNAVLWVDDSGCAAYAC